MECYVFSKGSISLPNCTIHSSALTPQLLVFFSFAKCVGKTLIDLEKMLLVKELILLILAN